MEALNQRGFNKTPYNSFYSVTQLSFSASSSKTSGCVTQNNIPLGSFPLAAAAHGIFLIVKGGIKYE